MAITELFPAGIANGQTDSSTYHTVIIAPRLLMDEINNRFYRRATSNWEERDRGENTE